MHQTHFSWVTVIKDSVFLFKYPINIYIYIYIYSILDFQTSLSCWTFTGNSKFLLLVTASLFRSPGLFPVFCRFWKYCGLDGLDYSSHVLFLQCFLSFWKTVTRAPTTIGITVTHMFHNFLSVLCTGPSICLYFVFFDVYSVVFQNDKILKITNHFLMNYHNVRSFDLDLGICLYLKIIENSFLGRILVCVYTWIIK